MLRLHVQFLESRPLVGHLVFLAVMRSVEGVKQAFATLGWTVSLQVMFGETILTRHGCDLQGCTFWITISAARVQFAQQH